MNTCLCGSEQGSPHRPGCPKPFWTSSPQAKKEKEVEKWKKDYFVNSRKLAWWDISKNGRPYNTKRWENIFGWEHFHAQSILSKFRLDSSLVHLPEDLVDK
jgi:hypothetical protein